MLTVKYKGSFRNTDSLLSANRTVVIKNILNKIGPKGVIALASATPKDTGKTSTSWSYFIEIRKTNARIIWTNTNVVNGSNIALVIQYGHGTANGTYVQPIDYINPAMSKIFAAFSEEIRMEVNRI